MKITLTQSGGLPGRTKTATAEWPYLFEEFTAMAKKMETNSKSDTRDGYEYFLRAGPDGEEILISIKSIDEKYSRVFEALFENMKFV